MAFYLCLAGVYEDYPTALRHVGFNLVSMACPGFASQDYEQMAGLCAPCGCCSCPTSPQFRLDRGGIKMIRA